MNASGLVWPMLVQASLTISLFFLLGRVRTAAFKRGGVEIKRAALHEDVWPDEVLKVSNNLRNQFETPVLFYVLCFALIALAAVTPLAVGLAWLYVASRLAHAWVHVRSNHVPTRFRYFVVGLVALIALVVLVATKAFSV
mgnify:CR=1 FL=1